MRLADAQVGAVYLLDDANRLVPVQAIATDGRASTTCSFGAEGLPKSVLERREPVFLRGGIARRPLPTLDLGVGTAPLRWVLAYPVALGPEAAGAIFLAGIHTPPTTPSSSCARPRGSSRWRCTTPGRTIACAKRASPSPSRASD